MGHRLQWAAGLGLATLLGTAAAAPLEITQEAVGADAVRISVIVSTIDEFSDWLAARDGAFDPAMLENSAEDAGFAFAYGGGFLAAPPVATSFASAMGVGSLDLQPDPGNHRFGATFAYTSPERLTTGTVLASFVVDRPATQGGHIQLVSLGITPLFAPLETGDDSGLPEWAGTLVAAAVPEPSSYLLMLAGLGAFMLRRRSAA